MDVPPRKQSEQHHSFTSFRPLSPESSKGVFTFSFPVPRIFTRKKNDTSKKSPDVNKLRKKETKIAYQTPSKSASPKLSHAQIQSRSRTPPLLRVRSSPLLSRRLYSGPKYHPGCFNQNAVTPFSVANELNAPGYRNLTAVLRRLSVIAGGQVGGSVNFNLKID